MDAIGAELGNSLAVAERKLRSADEEIMVLQTDLDHVNLALATEWTMVQNLSRALVNLAIPTTTAASSNKTESIPTPPKFNADRVRLRAWKNAVNLKLNIGSDDAGSDNTDSNNAGSNDVDSNNIDNNNIGSDDTGSDDAGSDNVDSNDAGSDDIGNNDIGHNDVVSIDASSNNTGSNDNGLHFNVYFDMDSNNNQPYRKFST
ncbi:hypothetical protein BGX38DRAFT_1334725 [Terfezia claveryi]|nr:hypothetical protein BGX38DRAFT_1334725 [Terfezia claveryi]